jgi:hypothetical protein
VHLGHVLETDPVLADQLFVHMHDDVVVLGVDRGDPAGRAEDLQDFPDVAKLHHPAEPVGPDIGGEHLDRGVALLDRLRERIEHSLRELAMQQEVKAVITITGAGPFALPPLDRLMQWLIGRAGGEIEQGRRAAIKCGAADLLGRRA